jgi:hypothetical protein
VRACAPPAVWLTIVVIVVRAAEGTKAAPMTAMETMTAAKASPVAAAGSVTAAAVAATTANKDEWAGCWSQELLWRPADIVRLCERGSGRTSESKYADKARRD